MITLNDGRTELWQWDTDVKLRVGAECDQVHFTNKIFGRSIDVNVVDGIAKIPDILLQSEKDLIVWGFVGTVGRGYTKISKIFKVNRRNKPADYVFTPTEQIVLSDVVERMNVIEKTVNPDIIIETVDKYLVENPPEETDPTVPDWAKQKTKPSYTAEDVGAVSKETFEKEFAKLSPIPQLYAPSVFQIGNEESGTIFEITDDAKNNGMTNTFNLYIDGEFVTSKSSNGLGALVDISSFVGDLNLGYHIITATAIGGGFGIAFKESKHSEIIQYKHTSSSGSVSVTLDAGETSKTVTIEGDYDILTINGIDGLTDAVSSVIYNGDGSITVNYASDVDVNIVIHYTISIE